MGVQVPFFRLLIPYIIGIIAALVVGKYANQLLMLIFVSALFVLLIIVFSMRTAWAHRWVFGVVTYAFLFAAGFTLTQLSQSETMLEHGGEHSAIVRLLDTPEVRLASTRVLAEVTMVHAESEWKPVREKLLLYFSATDSAALNLRYGDILAIKSAFVSPPPAKNPYQFDYAKYLSKKGIGSISFVPANSWQWVGHKPHWLHSTTSRLRAGLLSLFQRVGIRGENLAVLSALTMGYKALLDQETRRVFSASGAMHILAVSGLHVGILFATLSAFLFFFNRIKQGKLLKSALLILFLWFFAVFTGLSPSVIRAALMFSLVIVGTALSHKTSIYNTLSASAFVILVANPMLITEVGFQLSYLAVISIVFFYPYIYNLLYIKNRLIDKVWVLISVSLAAQLGTFVLGLYYFNQFPNYFLLTNLFAIPMAFVILYLTIGLLIFSPIPILAASLGWLLNGALSVLNYLIRFTEALPFSTSTGISLSPTQALILLISIVMLGLLLEYRKLVYIKLLLGCLLIFFVERSLRYSATNSQAELIVFAERQQPLLCFRSGSDVVLCTADTTTTLTSSNFSFALGGYLSRVGGGIDQPVFPVLNAEQSTNLLQGNVAIHRNGLGTWLHFKDKLILIPEFTAGTDALASSKFDVDILLITRNVAQSFPTVLTLVTPKVVVADETLPPWQVASISQHSKAHGVNFYSIAERGAYVLKL